MSIACSAAAWSATGVSKLMTIGIATPTVVPLAGRMVGDANGAVPVKADCASSNGATCSSGEGTANGSTTDGAGSGSAGAQTSSSESASACGTTPTAATSI